MGLVGLGCGSLNSSNNRPWASLVFSYKNRRGPGLLQRGPGLLQRNPKGPLFIYIRELAERQPARSWARHPPAPRAPALIPSFSCHRSSRWNQARHPTFKTNDAAPSRRKPNSRKRIETHKRRALFVHPSDTKTGEQIWEQILPVETAEMPPGSTAAPPPKAGGKVRLLKLADLDRRTAAYQGVAKGIQAIEADLGGRCPPESCRALPRAALRRPGSNVDRSRDSVLDRRTD